MITVEPIVALPRIPLAKYSAEEVGHFGADLADAVVKESAGAWLVQADVPLAILGVIRPSLMGRLPDLWFLLAKGFNASYLRQFREISPALLDLYPAVQTSIENTFPVGAKFARFLGFRPTQQVEERLGRTYTIYRRSA